MEQFFEQITIALMIGHLAVLYRRILAHEEILNWWFRFGSRFEGKWFWKPIWGCHLCISGQIALWTYVINWFLVVILTGNGATRSFVGSAIPIYPEWNYNVLNLLIFVGATIGFAFFINLLYSKAED